MSINVDDWILRCPCVPSIISLWWRFTLIHLYHHHNFQIFQSEIDANKHPQQQVYVHWILKVAILIILFQLQLQRSKVISFHHNQHLVNIQFSSHSMIDHSLPLYDLTVLIEGSHLWYFQVGMDERSNRKYESNIL